MYPRTSRRNGCCSDQQSFHQLLKVVGENGLEWRAIVRKEHLGGTKRLKKPLEQRKFKAWLQDRSSSYFLSRYTEARKAATLAVKKSKEKSWEEFGRRLDSNYFSANKVFWQTIRRLRGKRSNVTYSIKDSDGNILTDENEILSRWRKYFEDILNPVKASTRDTHEVTHLGKTKFSLQQKWQLQLKG